MSNNHKIKTICLTGGSCSGKTTFLNILKEQKEMEGYRFLFIPEAATLLMRNGFHFSDGVVPFEKAIIDFQFHVENLYRSYAEAMNEDICIICDRGVVDVGAYTNNNELLELMNYMNVSSKDELYSRYNGVVYMVSAALGAPGHYSNSTNETRRETLNEAMELEFKTIKQWKDHPYIAVVDNEGEKTFADKLMEAEEAVRDILKHEA